MNPEFIVVYASVVVKSFLVMGGTATAFLFGALLLSAIND